MSLQASTGESERARSRRTGVMAELRAATWPAHQRLEQRIDVEARFTDRLRYREHLTALWAFCHALEGRLEARVIAPALADYELRRKTPLLTRDLAALGMDSGALEAVARCRRLPDCTDTESALGCVYVLEGATLGGRTLVARVAGVLGLDAAHGLAFLSSYGDDVGPMWRRFGAAMEDWCEAPERRARAIGAAVFTFDCLADWLCTPV